MTQETTSDRSQSGPPWLGWDRIESLFWVILFVASICRFWGLHEKPYHHDESLYGTYCKNLYTGAPSLTAKHYDPMLHGPLTFHLTVPVFFVAGVTEASARFVPVIAGILTILCVWGMRNRLGRTEALIACAMTAFSPVMLYFSRFLRHDAPFNLYGVAAIFFFLRYLDTKKARYYYGIAVMLCCLACTKENAFVNFFIFGSFLVMYGLYRVWFDRGKGTFGSLDIVAKYPLVVQGLLLMGILGLYFMVFGALHYIKLDAPKTPTAEWAKKFKYLWYSFFVVVFLVLGGFHLGHYLYGSGKDEENGGSFLGILLKETHILTIATGLFTLLFVFLYTSGFRTEGKLFFWKDPYFWKGVYGWFFYWAHQHHVARIKGPFHYYMPLLALYEILPLSVACIGFLLKLVRKPFVILLSSVWIILAFILVKATSLLEGKSELLLEWHAAFALTVLLLAFCGVWIYLKEGRPVRALLVYWMAWTFCTYSFFQEKVPWLMMHMTMPMILLSSLYIGDLLKWNRKVARNVLLSLIGLLGVYTVHSSVLLCYRNEADPKERMVYVQTAYNSVKIAEKIKEASFRAGTNEDTHLTLQATNSLEWPLMWYLRDYKNIAYPATINVEQVIKDPPPAMLLSPEFMMSNKATLSQLYLMTRYNMRVWWEPDWKKVRDTGSFDYKNVAEATKKTWMSTPRRCMIYKLFRYVMYRDVFSVVGSLDGVLCLRRDLGWGGDLPPDRDALIKMLPQKAQAKIMGVGELSEPRGVAVHIDGRVAVADSQRGRVRVFNEDGRPLAYVGRQGHGFGQLWQPVGVAFDAEGNLAVADTWNHRVQMFSPKGDVLGVLGDSTEVGFFYAPKDVAFDEEGRLYVADTGHHRICVFEAGTLLAKDPRQPVDPSLHFVFSMGGKDLKPGSEPGQLNEPVGLAIGKDGNVLVADTVNGRIAVFDEEGNWVRSLPLPSDAWRGEEDRYREPFLALGPEGHIYVSDSKNNRIMVLDAKGSMLRSVGRTGKTAGEFTEVKGLAFSSSGHLYATDTQNRRLQRVEIQ